jgi:hypothetical protein
MDGDGSNFFDGDSPPIQLTYGVSSSPIPRDPTKPPKYVKTNLTKEEEDRIKRQGIRKGGKTKKRKPKSRRRRNGRTYRRS